MNVVTRGVRDAFRNPVRTLSIVLILGLSIGLALSMLIANKAVGTKIQSVQSSIGNTITLAPAGTQGFEGGGNPLTTDQVNKLSGITHVTGVDESIIDRLTTDNSNLSPAIDAGSLGKRFGGGGASSGSSTGPGGQTRTFTIPVEATGTTDPSKINGSAINITSGSNIDGSKDANVALVSTSLATKNNLSVGSTFTAYNTTITVQGIFDTGNTFQNNQVLFSLAALQRLSSQTGSVTSAVVTVDSITNMDGVVSAVRSQLGSAADVTSSKDSAASAIAPLESIKNVSMFSLIGAVVAGSVIILLTMVMIVRERKREIGVIKAIGGSNIRIMFQFMTEAITLTMIAAIVGLGIGVVGGNPITKALVSSSSSDTSTTASTGTQPGGGRGAGRGMARLTGSAPATNIKNINATVGWSIIFYGVGAAIGIALIGSALAAGMISKVRPSEVMRTE
jgi:putative ABC transport system permease protein